MTSNDNLDINELIKTYKEYLGEQAQEIIVLRTLVRALQHESTSKKPDHKKDISEQ
jgi:hypothetical protein